MIRSPRFLPETTDSDWLALPGGELEAPRPCTLCIRCRERLRRAAARGSWPSAAERPRTLCFGCHRAQIDRDRKLRAAASLDTASEERFQCTLPFEPVNRARLNQLRVARAHSRKADLDGPGVYVDKRRRAQIAARHALRRVTEGLRTHAVNAPERHATFLAAVHAAELQLPDAWLPFVVSR
jgi:hypothetical protein